MSADGGKTSGKIWRVIILNCSLNQLEAVQSADDRTRTEVLKPPGEFSRTFSLFNATQIPSAPELGSSRSLMARSGQSFIFQKSVLPRCTSLNMTITVPHTPLPSAPLQPSISASSATPPPYHRITIKHTQPFLSTAHTHTHPNKVGQSVILV